MKVKKMKMHKKSRKISAILLLSMLIILPINSSLALAGIIDVNAEGKDKVNGYIRETDQVDFSVSATIAGDTEITTNQVLLGSNVEFGSCTAGIDGFDCTLKFPDSGDTTFDAKQIPYTITLKSDSGTVIDTKTDSFYVDNLPPTVNSFSVDTSVLSTGKIRLKYEVQDRACSGSGCEGKCSGISKIELFETGSSYKETITLNTNSCLVSDRSIASITQFSEGSHTVFAKAYDNFGLASSVLSATFDFDKSAPSIDTSSFTITDSSNLPLDHFGSSPVPVIVKINIHDSDLNKNNVFADLSQITGSSGDSNKKALCSGEDAVECSWQLSLNPGNPGTKTMKVEATDGAGNKATTDIQKNMQLDNSGPVVLSITSFQTQDGKSFAKLTDNNFLATFSEQDSGLKKEDIVLHASNSKSADSCVSSGGIWQCEFSGINFASSGTSTVYIGSDSTDRLGNKINSQFSQEVLVDTSRPSVLKVVSRGIGGSSSLLANLTTTGSKIQVEAAISDDNIESASGDFSKFIFNADNIPADSCIKTAEKTFVCSWTTSSIDIEGHINDFITLKFKDTSGNILEAKERFVVYGTDGARTADFYTSNTRCSPANLDRGTMALIEQRAYCIVSLIPQTLVNDVGRFEAVEPISMSLGECTGDTGFVQNVELLNDQTVEPVLKVTFQRQGGNIDKVDLLCPLNIISKQGNTIITTPETENADINFRLYNLPVGELEDSVQTKIDTAVEDADNALKIATTLKKLFFYGKQICQVGNTLANVVVLYRTVGVVWDNWDAITTGTPVNAPAKVKREAWNEVTEAMRQNVISEYPMFNKACNFVNCKTVVDSDAATFDFEGPDSILGKWRAEGKDIIGKLDVGNVVSEYVGDGGEISDPSRFMNPRDSIAVATLTACVPGIIHGLDKYRQIQCMYADCLKTGVGVQGLPVYACDDQKSYAECKYVVGEIFQILPITAMFDYYANLIKNTLSNPFKILGSGIALVCQTGSVEPYSYGLCSTTKIISLLGSTIQEVTSIFDSNQWTVQDDFCKRLDESNDDDDSSGDSEESGGLFGWF
ncbi:hypothetical protein ISS07_02155 [Candidatus Woesearchaeota archaeon]|nr:hypothetical protein [Candidatus Woesearchaeota archaeon]